MQTAFTLDINKCTGCQACRVACEIENQLAPGTSWRAVETFNARRHPGIPLYHLSLACNHCIDPPCMEHCPALAYSKDADTGAVTVDPARCIGCKYCTWACPYDAPRFDESTGVVTKCTLCDHRLKDGKRPACVTQCPTGALQVADLDTAVGEEAVPGFPRADARPAIRFVPLRDWSPAGGPAPAPPAGGDRLEVDPAPTVRLRTEWPLVVFTLLAAVLVALMTAPGGRARLGAGTFVVLSAVAAAFSTQHLGRRRRAYRALLNWRRSWLSREIILFTTFAGFGTLHLVTGHLGPVTGWISTIAGCAMLFAMDAVYGVTRTRGLWRHSARMVLTGILAWGIVAGLAPVFVGVGVAKAVLYIYRKVTAAGAGGGSPWLLGGVRVGLGLFVPAALWLAGGGALGWGAVALVCAGEAIDRCEFYVELDIPSPAKESIRDLTREIASVRAT